MQQGGERSPPLSLFPSLPQLEKTPPVPLEEEEEEKWGRRKFVPLFPNPPFFYIRAPRFSLSPSPSPIFVRTTADGTLLSERATVRQTDRQGKRGRGVKEGRRRRQRVGGEREKKETFSTALNSRLSLLPSPPASFPATGSFPLS